jgi:hypothetical protein
MKLERARIAREMRELKQDLVSRLENGAKVQEGPHFLESKTRKTVSIS